MANRIKEIRNDKSVSQKALAAMAEVSQPYLFDLENGRRGARQETWERIADALGVTVDDLRGDDNDSVSDHPTSG